MASSQEPKYYVFRSHEGIEEVMIQFGPHVDASWIPMDYHMAWEPGTVILPLAVVQRIFQDYCTWDPDELAAVSEVRLMKNVESI